MGGSKKSNIWTIRVTTQQNLDVMNIFKMFNVVIKKKDVTAEASMLAWVVEKEDTDNRHYHIVVEYQQEIIKNHLDKFLNREFGTGNENHSSKPVYEVLPMLRYMSKQNKLYGLWYKDTPIDYKSIDEIYEEQKLFRKEEKRDNVRRENLLDDVYKLCHAAELNYDRSYLTVDDFKLQILEIYMKHNAEQNLLLKSKFFIRTDIDNLFFKLVPRNSKLHQNWLKTFL